MEVLNPTIPNRPQFFSTIAIFSPKYSFTTLGKKTPRRFSKLSLHPPFSARFPLCATGLLRISAQFGRPTRRRNSLRKKLTKQQQQVRQNPIIYDPGASSRSPLNDFDNNEPYSTDLDSGRVEESKVNSSYGVTEGTVNSDSVEESESKPLIDSALGNELENWVDQYQSDSDFWGLGFGPIFSVYQDSEGNIEKVVVNEDEILRRSKIEPELYEESQVEVLTEVNLKISHAKSLAREVKSGNYVFPENSSVAKFLVSNRKSSFINSIRSFSVQPGLSLKLPRIGIMVLCGFLVFWAMNRLFTGKKGKGAHTRFEKEIMRRKVKARKEKEKLVMGDVEVVQEPMELQIDPAERPRLNKQELMNFIMKEKASNSTLKLQDVSTKASNSTLELREIPKNESNSVLDLQETSSDQATSKDLDTKIQEIREMARRAREIEKRDSSPGDSDGGYDLTDNALSNQEEAVKQQREGEVSLPNDLSSEHLGQPRASNGTLVPISSNDLKCDDIGFSEEALVENSDTKPFTTSSMTASGDGDSSVQDVFNQEGGVKISDTNGVSQSTDTLESQSRKPKKSLRPKRVIRSVNEAKEFLSRRRDDLQTNQELEDRTVPEDAAILSHKRVKETDNNARRLVRDIVVPTTTILDGTSDFTPSINEGKHPVLKRKEYVSTEKNYPEAADKDEEVNIGSAERGTSVLALVRESERDNSTSLVLDKDNKVFQTTILGGSSESMSAATVGGGSTNKDGDRKDVEKGYRLDDQKPRTSFAHGSNSTSTKTMQAMDKENWMEKNFDKLEPLMEKIGGAFRDSYVGAKEKAQLQLDIHSEMKQLIFDDSELDWMKDDKVREIVFQVRENELAGKDPFYLMDEDDKLTFFEGLEKKVEKENEKLSNLHVWLHSNIENLHYGADGISLYDPPEKIVPHWKGPPVDEIPELLNNTANARNLLNSDIVRTDGQINLQKSKESPSTENSMPTSAGNNPDTQTLDGTSKRPRTVIEGSDGSVRAGKKSGKEFWQHTKKWSRGFLECYNAEPDPEVKAIMKDMGKDLDRWITEKQVKKAASLMDRLPERGRKFIDKRVNKLKREIELFGQQAVMSKYREYAEEKEEDYLWWLDLPYVLCIEIYTLENGEQRTGFYSLEMAADLELDPKPYHVIAFEDPGDCKNLCYIIQAHMETVGNGNAFVVEQHPKDAFREAKANGFSVTVIRKKELQLNVDQTLAEVEEQITEIGSKMYHDKIMRERSMDISTLTGGVLGATKPTKSKRRRMTRRKLKKPTK